MSSPKFLIGLLICVVGLLWEFSASNSESLSLFASKPSIIFITWIAELSNKDYWLNVSSTLGVLLVGYLSSIVFGYLLGTVSYFLFRKGVELNFILGAFSSIPIFAIAPLLILAFGIGYWPRVSVVILSSVFLVSSGVFEAIKHCDEIYGSIIRDIKASDKRLWLKILFPGGIIFAIPSLKGAVALSLIGVFVAEWISSQYGLGKYMLSAMSLYDAPRLMIGIFTFMFLSSVLMGILTFIESKTLNWRKYR